MIKTLFHITPLTLVLLSLAAFRITRLITRDTFPLFAVPRNWLWSKFPPSGTYMDGTVEDRPPRVKHAVFQNTGRGVEDRWYIEKGHWLGDLTACDWCAGWWVSLMFSISYGLWPIYVVAFSVPWAIGAIVGLISAHQG
jgi:hypothetical protein